MQYPFVSFRADMAHVRRAGLAMLDDVDVRFGIREFSRGSFIVQGRLVKEGLESIELVTGCPFDMEDLGREYARLEVLDQSLIAITKSVTDCEVEGESDGGAMLTLKVGDQRLQFRLYPQDGGERFNLGDWFQLPVLSDEKQAA